MPEHNHITRGDVIGCPSCDVREGRGLGMVEVDWVDHVAPDLSAYPEVQHRIEGGVFVCPGDEKARCHQYPGCDGEHEFWPCGCEYVSHAECWIKPWIDASSLADSHDEGADDLGYLLLDEDFPDGDVETEWEGECVLWSYVLPDPRVVTGSNGPVHWVGEAPTSLHGNGAASFDRTTRDAAEVTCALCLTLLDRESNER